MQTFSLVESQRYDLPLTSDEGRQLASLGRKMSRNRADEASIIDCSPSSEGHWSIRVREAIGVIQVGATRIVCEPKIPMDHLMHLVGLHDDAFRTAHNAKVEAADDLWPLLAHWFLESTEHLIRSGISRDYVPAEADIPSARGKIVPLPTIINLYRGRVSVACKYEDFTTDSPLNRVIRAATHEVARSRPLSSALRRRAKRAYAHFEGVGDLSASDLDLVEVDQQTIAYKNPLDLALHILAGTGIGIGREADLVGRCFLLRTPDLVETGLRKIVSTSLDASVRKGKRKLPGSDLDLNPDLVFDSIAIGDVKYKLRSASWHRPDLYQLVAFATGYEVHSAIKLGFSYVPSNSSELSVGSVAVSECDWNCSVPPDVAQDEFILAMRRWWATIKP